jgi:hypothetical protein
MHAIWCNARYSFTSTITSTITGMQARYLALDFRADAHAEMTALVDDEEGLGIDGIFVDCPPTGQMWRACRTQYSSNVDAPGNMNGVGAPAHKAEQYDEVEVHPIVAVFVYALAGGLVLACVMWAARQRSESRLYKVASPAAELVARELDESSSWWQCFGSAPDVRRVRSEAGLAHPSKGEGRHVSTGGVAR